MVASSVWFLRVGDHTWQFLTGGAGVDPKTMAGPFDVVWHFGQYLLPLAVLELYFRARDSANEHHRSAMALGLIAVTILIGIGVTRASVHSWLPRIVGST